MISIIVSSYQRFSHIIRLVESVESAFSKENYELIAVCSDAPESEKVKWLKSRNRVRYIQGDVRTEKRIHSIYYYENLGIRAAQFPWIFVTNDDTQIHKDFYSEFLKLESIADVILVNGHIGGVEMGLRIPQIGVFRKPDQKKDQPLFLYDFTLIRKSIYEEIGFLDERLDWYGKGLDLALTIELKTRARILPQSRLMVDHDITLQNREPPDSHHDFEYLREKWKAFCDANHGYRYKMFGSKRARLFRFLRNLVRPASLSISREKRP